MPFVTAKHMLFKAQEGRYAVPAFNIENMEMAQAVIRAADDLKSPVIIQTTPSTVRYGGMGLYAAMVSCLAGTVKTPVSLHLDHGDSYALCVQAIGAGYSSLMIDGSKLTFNENIAVTEKVSEMAKALDIPVEGELGAVGGKEDDLVSAGPVYTDPDEAVEFVERTGVFSLAIGIGTAHGIYNGVPVLDMQRIIDITRKVSVPLVLHGTSGVPESDVRKCIRSGICKVNYATDLRIAFTDGVREAICEYPGAYDPKVYLKAGRERVYETVKARIELCGSQRQA